MVGCWGVPEVAMFPMLRCQLATAPGFQAPSSCLRSPEPRGGFAGPDVVQNVPIFFKTFGVEMIPKPEDYCRLTPVSDGAVGGADHPGSSRGGALADRSAPCEKKKRRRSQSARSGTAKKSRSSSESIPGAKRDKPSGRGSPSGSPTGKRPRGTTTTKLSYGDTFNVTSHHMLDAWKHRVLFRSLDMKEPRNVTAFYALLAICYQVHLLDAKDPKSPSMVTRLPRPMGPNHDNKTLFGWQRAEQCNEGRGTQTQIKNVLDRVDSGIPTHPLVLMLRNPNAVKTAVLILTGQIKFDFKDKFCTDTRHYNDRDKLVTTMFQSASVENGFCTYLAALKVLDKFANHFQRSTTSSLLEGLGRPAHGMSHEDPSFAAEMRGSASKKHVAFSLGAADQLRALEQSIIEHFSSGVVSNIVIAALDAAKSGTLRKSVKLPPVPYSKRVGDWRLTGKSRQVRPPDLVIASLANRQIRQLLPQSRHRFRHDIRNVFRGSDRSCLYQAPYAPVQAEDVEEDEEGEEGEDDEDDEGDEDEDDEEEHSSPEHNGQDASADDDGRDDGDGTGSRQAQDSS